MSNAHNDYWHRRLLEGRSGLFAILTTLTVSIGGLIEIVPMFTVGDGRIMDGEAETQPYTPLEVAGRDIYIREGCYVCHSQMVRPFRDETLRYGPWSRSEEYRYDRPFLLGSRRIGPDLHRVGGKYNHQWHYDHMMDPREITDGSIMPAYPWMARWEIDPADVARSVRALAAVGTPYPDTSDEWVRAQLEEQGTAIAAELDPADGLTVSWNTEIVALIAYLQRLGRNAEGPLAQATGGAE